MTAPAFPPFALSRLGRLYADLAVALASAGAERCDGCGRCCHFDVADHTLFATGLETAYWLERSGPFPPDAVHGVDRCPYQVGAVCLARDGRPLGCRLYDCRWPEAEMQTASEYWHAQLKRLHDDERLPWDYMPLLRRPELPW